MIHNFPNTKVSKRTQPDDWLYDRSVLGWILNPNLRKQLPFLYRIFGWYCKLYFGLTGKSYLRGGRELFRFLSNIFYRLSPDQYLELQLSGYQVFLNPTDMRLFQVVNELASVETDTRVLSGLLSEGDTFLDVGANHGSFAIVASKMVGEKGFVLAVEPQPRLAKALEKSLTANAICKFQIYNLAVGDTDGEIELLVPIGTSGSAGIFPEHSATHQYKTFTVPLKRFDELVDWQNFTGKVVLKLDVEGSECAFLSGARKMIAALKPTLIIEVHPTSLRAAGATGDQLKKLLQELGYKYYAEIADRDRTFALEDLNTNIQRNVVMMMA
ncbi:MAG: FkbM family methyltransferase [Pseudanabaena sp.]|jgi:FkbM family methyltransferase